MAAAAAVLDAAATAAADEQQPSQHKPAAGIAEEALTAAAAAARQHACAAGEAVRRTAKKLHGRSGGALRALEQWWRRVRSYVWYLVEELFEEFQPWLKWIVFDAALTLVVGWLAKRFTPLRPLFEAVGWA